MATIHDSSAFVSDVMTTAQAVNEDPLLLQREVDVETVALQIRQKRIANRNKNTIKAYAKGQREWKRWCGESKFSDGDLVREKKLLLFLQEVVLPMRTVPRTRKSMSQKLDSKRKRNAASKRRKRAKIAQKNGKNVVGSNAPATSCPTEPESDEEGSDSDEEIPPEGLPLAPDTIESSYISALVSLWEDQAVEERNKYPQPRGSLIRAFVEDIHIKRADIRRAAYEDRAIAGLKDGYTEKEFLSLSECLLGRQIDGRVIGREQALRTRLDMLLMHCMMLRSETTRAAELADFESILLMNEGPEDAFAVVMRQRGGKTKDRKDGSNNRKTHYHGFLRHKNVRLCPVGALSQWFFYRWEISRETPPDFRSRGSWYKHPLLPKALQTPEEGLSSETQGDWIRRVFEEVHISSTKLLHTFRKSSARAMDLAEVPLEQIRRAGGWESGALNTSYLSRLPRNFMRVVAGHPTIAHAYFLKRGAAQPPRSLTSLVWPWADQALAMYRAGQIKNPDLTGKFFCELLKSLRIVLLQDAAILSSSFPNYGLWDHPVFRHPDWTPFVRDVLGHEATVDDPLDVQIQKALPLVSERMAAIQNSVVNAVREESSSVRSKLDGLKADVRSNLDGINRRLNGLDGTMKSILRKQGQPLGSFMLVPANGGRSSPIPGPSTSNSHGADAQSLIPTTQADETQGTGASSNHGSDPLTNVSPNPLSRPAACPEGCPIRTEPIAASMRSMYHVYREWYSGLEGPGGEPLMSIVQLEAQFGKAWRYNSALRTRCCDRKLLVKTMEEESRQSGRSIEAVIQECDDARPGGNPISPDKFKRELRKGKSLRAILGG